VLYASAGDGASFNYADERPTTTRTENPCGDPFKEGGSIRSQDLRTTGDPLGLDGSVLKLDPDVPLARTDLARTAAMIGHGLRNPFRIAVRPGTGEIWSGDVGWNRWEEINRLVPGGVRNFGWPCYEGAARMGSWDGLNNPVCEGLYAEGPAAHTAPHYAYDHGAKVVPGETCPSGTSSISGLDFYDGGTFPAEYDGALIFADYARRCAWAMLRGANGLPDPAQIRTFVTDAGVVDLQVGPGGDLFYVVLAAGTVRRVHATSGNRGPTARLQATPDRGPAPLTVALDGRASSDPDGTPLAYAWDTDLDGFDDGTGAQLGARFTTTGAKRVRLRVTDPSGLSDVAETTVHVGVAPSAAIATPAAGTAWQVGDRISFSGSGTAADGSPLPASALRWQLDLQHCPRQGCHVHPIQTWAGTAGGSFSAPDHEYPSWLELRLTASDGGLETTVTRRIDPRTSRLTVASEPAGLAVFLGSETGPSPLAADVIVGSTSTIGAETPQAFDGRSWAFTGWPAPGEPNRAVVATAADATYTLHFDAAAAPAPDAPRAPTPAPGPDGDVAPATEAAPVAAWSFDRRGRALGRDDSGNGHRAELRGDARRAARGRHGGALRLGGRGSAVIAPRGAARLRGPFTVSAWVRPGRRAADAAAIAGERRGATAFSLGVRRAGAAWRGGLRHDARMRPGRWTHLALRWDGRELALFADGREAGPARPVAGARIGRLVRLRLGGDAGGRRLRGKLDDVRVYDAALDDAAIAADLARAVGD
jgi:PKD repeat protein